MKNSIKNVLGPMWNTIKLYDDNSISYGGISHSEETLGEFMAECEINPFEPIGKLQKALKDCGIKQIEIADHEIQEMIEEKIIDIEDELGVEINYTWDYYEFKNG